MLRIVTHPSSRDGEKEIQLRGREEEDRKINKIYSGTILSYRIYFFNDVKNIFILQIFLEIESKY